MVAVRPWPYIKSNVVALVAGALLASAMGLVVWATGGSAQLVAFVIVLVVLTLAACLAYDYSRRARFFGELESLAETLDNPRLVHTLIEGPDMPEARSTLSALERVSKSANDEVAEARRQVEDYREYVETWVHEAKSPLAAAHLMLDNMDAADPAGVAAKREALDEELCRVERYIEQALFYARSEAVERDYLIREHDLYDLVSATLKANAHALIGAHMAVRMEGLEGVRVFTDEKWMQFVLGQLVQNSVKYARGDGAEIRFDARRVCEGLADEHVVLTVRDNGCGVSQADLPRVFDKGFTGENGRAGKRSTGIGLYLVKRLCDKMALGVEAASREGEGFAVEISFPANKMHFFE